MKTFNFIIILVFLLAGCTNNNEPLPIPEDAKAIQLQSGLEKRISQDNEFAFDIFKRTIAESGETNVFISPLSISIALGMLRNGAAGITRTEIDSTLKMMDLSNTEINEYYKVMQSTLPGIDPTTKLNIANSLWYRTGVVVKPDFLSTNTNYFNAEVRELDFSQTWAKDTINNWCARKTNNLIKEVLDEVPSNAIMYLINAIYFKGIWRKQFEKKNTSETNFTTQTNQTVRVNMMYQKDTFLYAQDENAQYLDLAYGNKAFSMTVILPNSGKTTDDLLNVLTLEKWNQTLDKLTSKEVEVYLPRFKTKCKFVMNNELIGMGMKSAFYVPANLSNMIDGGNLLISRVLHDTYVEVTEEGTEAAAVTVVEIKYTAMPEIPVFRVDKPFVFVIREKSTGVILFMGKMGSVEKF